MDAGDVAARSKWAQWDGDRSAESAATGILPHGHALLGNMESAVVFIFQTMAARIGSRCCAATSISMT